MKIIKQLFVLFGFLLSSIFLASCGGGSSGADGVGTPTVVSIAITPTNAMLSVAMTADLTATATYSDNSTKIVSGTSTWNSSNTEVLTVGTTGVITGVAAGTSSITASLNGVTSSAVHITVTGAATLTNIGVTPASLSVAAGLSQQFVATGTYTDATTGNISGSVNWVSSDNAIVTVNTTGLATTIAQGTATITATDGIVFGTATLAVTAPIMQTITASPLNTTITTGETQQFIATANFSDNSTQNVSSTATWVSSNTAVATVDSAGLATALTSGTASITTSLNGVTSTAVTINVTSATLTSINVSPSSPSLVAGGTQQFSATGTFSDSSTSNISGAVTWISDNSSVATISDSGLATGVSAGAANITASQNGVTSPAVSITVTVSPTIEIITAGGDRSTALKRDGTVWGWGYNASGQLGDGTTINKLTPVQVTGLTDVIDVADGFAHTLALKSDGTVWTWGDNTYGQLGDGTTTNRKIPVQVTGLTGVKAIAGGGYHSIALKNDGTVWTWGDNINSQLGDGTTTERTSPVQVTGLTSVTSIVGGGFHTLALRSDGTVWSWGYNFNGQLGDGTYTQRSFPVQVAWLTGITEIDGGWKHSIALTSDGTVWAWGDNSYKQLGQTVSYSQSRNPLQVTGLTNVISLAAGDNHNVALKSDGTVSAWGYNSYGQLGDGTTTSNSTPTQVAGLTGITRIAAGGSHALVENSDGTILAWGKAGSGQLGNGISTTSSKVPVQTSGFTSTPTFSPSTVTASLSSPTSISVNWNVVTGATSYNLYWSTSPNVNPLNGTKVVSVTPPYAHNGTTSGTIYYYVVTAIGTGGESAISSVAAYVNGGAKKGTIISIEAGGAHTVALMNNGSVWTWGSDNYNQLGAGANLITSSTPLRVQSPGFTDVIDVAAGGSHSVALQKDGTVWTWGANGSGQLGDGTTTQRISPVQVSGLTDVIAVTARNSQTFALKSDGTVWAWGSNSLGQLGDGTTTSKNTPIQVSGLGGITAIAAGGYHTVALKNDGTVWTWGSNTEGALGDGTSISKNFPIQVPGLNGITSIAAGNNASAYNYDFTIALKSDGTVWSWGSNGSGQLGDGTTTLRLTPVQTSVPTGIIAIAAGSMHALALNSDGTVWAWGSGGFGQLGDGINNTSDKKTTPTQIPSFTGATTISANSGFSLALKNDGLVWAWGFNTDNELGDGSGAIQSSPVQTQLFTALSVTSPRGVSASVLSASSTSIAWNSSIGAISYNLYWSTFPDVNPLTGNKLSGVTSPYTHSGLTAGTTYYYVLTSVNTNGESASSSVVNARP